MPKRAGHLLEKIATTANVLRAMAVYNSHIPPRRRHRIDVRMAQRIAVAIRDGGPAFGNVIGTPHEKIITESGKERRLRIAPYQSRIAQTAIMEILEPIINRALHRRTYSSRRGYGGHRCAREQLGRVRRDPKGTKYCLQFDIRKFYDHIDHDTLIGDLSRRIKDPHVIDRVRTIIASCQDGLAIGYPGSHTLANLYLDRLYYALRAVKGVAAVFVYMDNIWVYSGTKAALHRARRTAAVWLAGRAMTIKRDWQIFRTADRYANVCGFRVSAGRKTKLYRRIHRRAMRNAREFERRPTPHGARAIMSRAGWYQAAGRENAINPDTIRKARRLTRHADRDSALRHPAI